MEHREACPRTVQTEAPAGPRPPVITSSHQKLGEGHGAGSAPRSHRRSQPCPHPDLGPGACGAGREQVAVVSSCPVCDAINGGPMT